MPQQKFLQLTPIDSRIRIPQHYQRQPLISRLVSRYSITVNITAAMLTPTENYGWFDLDLWGKPQQLFSSFNHLKTLQLPLWLDASSLHGHLI